MISQSPILPSFASGGCPTSQTLSTKTVYVIVFNSTAFAFARPLLIIVQNVKSFKILCETMDQTYITALKYTFSNVKTVYVILPENKTAYVIEI